MSATGEYLAALNSTLTAGDATEHSHRPAFKAWAESFKDELTATNEPKQSESNAPDFDIKKQRRHGSLSIGKIEAKDVGVRPGLKAIEDDSNRDTPRTANGRQLKRYRNAFANLLLTDYVEFRWYRRGDLRATARLGAIAEGQIIPDADGIAAIDALMKAFLEADPERIRSAPNLARRMAGLAAIIQDVVHRSLTKGAASDTTVGLKAAFEDTLVPDLSDEQFSDMLAQTIAYGLFAARAQAPGADTFTRSDAAHLIPRTNPFVRGLFAHLVGPALNDEPYAGLVDDLAQLLSDADVDHILSKFGAEKGDPTVHFYETFLGAYNPSLRDIRGVYYTPLPVVDFIVKNVDHVLKESFALRDGIADTSRTSDGQHKVLVLDPATGTGTFLYATIARIRNSFIARKRTSLWSAYVSEHLLPRMFGFELMVAPYAVAHLKLALQLGGKDLPRDERHDIEYDFAKDERIGVYLTNALDPAEAHTTLPLGKFITDEANAASAVKSEKPIMVVMGNPPYQGQSANSSTRREFSRTVKGAAQYKTVKTAIGTLLEDYYAVDGAPLGEVNSKWLQDDYVKFIRLGQDRIERTGQGVLSYVTNHTYLDAPTFRGMRASLLRTFDDIYVLDLHGSMRRREVNPDGGVDENVFDAIQQGVAIALFVKSSDSKDLATIHYTDAWGSRKAKYEWLEETNFRDVQWESFTPTSPFYGFRPEDQDIRAEWDAAVSLTEIFPVYSTGIVTHRDDFAVNTRRDRLLGRLKDFCDPKQTDAQVRAKYFGTNSRTTATGITYLAGDNRDWSMSDRRASLIRDSARAESIKPMTHRPFDNRFVMYHRDAIDARKYDVMRHMLDGANLGLVSARSNKSPVQDQFYVTDLMTEVKAGEATTGSVLFPLWLFPEPGVDAPETLDILADGQSEVRPNLGSCVTVLMQRLGLELISDGSPGDLVTTANPHDVLDYIYGVVHSRTYRLRYEAFLRSDYPRIPFTSDRDTFAAVCAHGRRLRELHTLKASDADDGPAEVSAGSNLVDKIPLSTRWALGEDGVGHIVLNLEGAKDGGPQVVTGVSADVWEYHIGGHRVLHKWLDARARDTLTFDELEHLLRTVNALTETIETQDRIEELLSSWPLPGSMPAAAQDQDAGESEVVRHG
ncbi:type ISP restriction/modification enzyme [Serinicoccus kebangsaanensis]|uniref:type ISP restriction/modification enzyme n=1 Tax=Serinicoccus kebangsaanensis TaxID=2602069 RepID=UPI00124CE1AF|nr:type ISP restriction/modification enzyme [Serinicoccus kebangsaanensis]